MKLLWAVQRYGEQALGGSEVAGREFAEQMVALGHEVTVLTSCATSYTDWANVYEPGESELNGVRIVRLPVREPRRDSAFGPVHRQVLSETQPMLFQQQRWARLIGPDLLGYEKWLSSNVNGFDVAIFKAYLYSMATRGIPLVFKRVPILYNPEAHPEEMLNLALHDSIFRLADAFQFHSREEAELVLRHFSIQKPHVVVGIGVKNHQFMHMNTNILQKFDLVSRKYAIVVGRIDGGKGSDDAISNFKRYQTLSNSDLKLVFVGGHADSQDFPDSVCSTGFVTEDEKRDLIANSLCLIQPSFLESFSIVLTEAWALKVPVLVQGRSAVLRGQTNRARGGLVYTNEADFCEQLRHIESDEELRTQCGQNGYEFVRSEYSWELVMARFERAIDLARSSFVGSKSRQ